VPVPVGCQCIASEQDGLGLVRRVVSLRGGRVWVLVWFDERLGSAGDASVMSPLEIEVLVPLPPYTPPVEHLGSPVACIK
jgi:hypothetical protein